ncbi:beta-propeller domain-containing protein [Candidatus Peregrinibacteria bacterium]|nr:beta-propeller domain-containing protein [Candidatus Peregrinibacteria bacterium]
MKLHKVLAGTLITGILAGFLVIVNSAGAFAVGFSDVPTSYPYSQAVTYLKDEGVVEGYGDGTYLPENTIVRAEFVKIILLASGATPEGSDCFPDVKNEWFAPYVCKAKSLGMISGYPDGTFKPERPINFAESGRVVINGLDIPSDDLLTDTWFHQYVSALEDKSAIPETVATFDQYINRGEMAEMIWRLQVNPTGVETGSYDELLKNTQAELFSTISDCNQLKEKFAVSGSNYYYDGDVKMAVQEAESGATSTAPSVSQDEASGLGDSSATRDYSETNVQVAGVDEADIVKTDGEYIYQVVGQTVKIIRAYPPMALAELDAVTFTDDDFWPRDMYVDGNKLVVLGTSYVSYPYPVYKEDARILPYPYYGGTLTKIFIFDITDKTNIKNFRSLSFEGDYTQSRKVDEMVYVVMNRPGFWAYSTVESADEILPRYQDTADETAKPLCGCTDVKYIPAYESANYLIVTGIPIDTNNAAISKEVILGSSENIYASTEHLYVAATDWNYWMYDSFRAPSNTEQTTVYKFNLERENVKFLGKGKVPGRILNQFSMDEWDDHFRIATTKGWSWDDSLPSINNVYILDDTMNMTGKIEGIAPGEEIYSMRFMGKRAYMVTFKKIDPFFVIDMSDHEFPKILGKLKIPGYSDYLHPYDDNHIIGFGKDTELATEAEMEGWGMDFVWYQGIKVALFDVTDVENPKEMYKVIIGDRGTDSPLLYDHKALLFDKNAGLLAFPVLLAEIKDKTVEYTGSEYGDYVFQGAYVYHLDLDTGFKLWGTISHYDTTEQADKSGYYWYGNKDVQRILYIGDYLYTVSQRMVKANRKQQGVAEINKVELESTTEYDYSYSEPMPI